MSTPTTTMTTSQRKTRASGLSEGSSGSTVKKRCRFCFQFTPVDELKDHPMGLQIGLPEHCMCPNCARIWRAGQWCWRSDEKGKDEFCRMCGEGNLGTVSCDVTTCQYSFCEGCILANVGQQNYLRILDIADENQWHCFVCTLLTAKHAILHQNPNATFTYSNPVTIPPSSPNHIRQHLHLSARAAAGGFTKRTIFDAFALQRKVPTFTYFDRNKKQALRRAINKPIYPRRSTAAASHSISPHSPVRGLDSDWEDFSEPESEVDEDEDLPRILPPGSLDSAKHEDGLLRSPHKKKTPSEPTATNEAETLKLEQDAASSVDSSSTQAVTPSPQPLISPPTLPHRPMKRIISYSFFLHELHTASAHTPYIYGLLENIRRIHRDWPEWTVRIYYDHSFELQGPQEIYGPTAPVDGMICKVKYQTDLRTMWYTVLRPQLMKLPFVELRRFHWPHLQDKDHIHHGSIGCFARFLALADLGVAGGVEQVMMADVDNHLTVQGKALMDSFVQTHQRFHDPRYAVPVWAGGFSVRIPPAYSSCPEKWTNPYANIESVLMNWCYHHCRDPKAIEARPEMFRSDNHANQPGGHHHNASEFPGKKGEAERKAVEKQRAEEEEQRHRDRLVGLNRAKEAKLQELLGLTGGGGGGGSGKKTSGRIKAEQPPERKQPKRGAKQDDDDEAEKPSSQPLPTRSSKTKAIPFSPHALTPPDNVSTSLQQTRASKKVDSEEHKTQLNPRIPTPTEQHHPTSTSTSSSLQQLPSEKRRSSRGHLSTLAYEKEIQQKATSREQSQSPLRASTPQEVKSADQDDGDEKKQEESVAQSSETHVDDVEEVDDECIEISPPNKTTTPTPSASKSKKTKKKPSPRKSTRSAAASAPASMDELTDTSLTPPSPLEPSLALLLPLHKLEPEIPDPDLPTDSEEMEFFPYGSDQVFLTDCVWPIMQLDCETTWALLPTAQLSRTQKVWPPVLTPEEQTRVLTAMTYWSLFDWMPNQARPKPREIIKFVKEFILTKWAEMYQALQLNAYQPEGITYMQMEEYQKKLATKELIIPTPIAPHAIDLQLERAILTSQSSSSTNNKRKHHSSTNSSASVSPILIDDDDQSTHPTSTTEVSGSISDSKSGHRSKRVKGESITPQTVTSVTGETTTRSALSDRPRRQTKRKFSLDHSEDHFDSEAEEQELAAALNASATTYQKEKRGAIRVVQRQSIVAEGELSPIDVEALPTGITSYQDEDDDQADGSTNMTNDHELDSLNTGSDEEDEQQSLQSTTHSTTSSHPPPASSLQDEPIRASSKKRPKLAIRSSKLEPPPDETPAQARKSGRPGRRPKSMTSAVTPPTYLSTTNVVDSATTTAASSSSTSSQKSSRRPEHPPHYLDECDFGCQYLHEARLCQFVTAPDQTQLCRHQQQLSLDMNASVRVIVVPPPTSAATAMDTTSELTSTKVDTEVPVKSLRSEDSDVMVDAEPSLSTTATSSPDTPTSAAATSIATSTVSRYSARSKKAPTLYGSFLNQPPSTVAASTTVPSSSQTLKKDRILCTCTCIFCSPTHFTMPSSSGRSRVYYHPSQPDAPWPWSLSVTQSWLTELCGESFLPFSTYLEEAKLSTDKTGRRFLSGGFKNVEELINTHPVRLLKLMIKAKQTFGGTDCPVSLLAYSLYLKLTQLKNEMLQQLQGRK